MGGVRGPDAQLVLQADQVETGGVAGNEEGLDGGTAGGLVQGGPDDDVVAALTGGVS